MVKVHRYGSTLRIGLLYICMNIFLFTYGWVSDICMSGYVTGCGWKKYACMNYSLIACGWEIIACMGCYKIACGGGKRCMLGFGFISLWVGR